MTQATLPRPRGAIDAEQEQHGLPTRPIEDRSFEAVETTVGVVAGAAVGMVVAGPVGAVVGGAVGAGVAFAAAEAVERAQGLASLTTDAEEHPPHR
ncbi:MAG: hypothetical protein FIA92_08085 [Chloroflexi bacterium]|nr:hypothetical protein [Chloroflexota bacterium]